MVLLADLLHDYMKKTFFLEKLIKNVQEKMILGTKESSYNSESSGESDEDSDNVGDVVSDLFHLMSFVEEHLYVIAVDLED